MAPLRQKTAKSVIRQKQKHRRLGDILKKTVARILGEYVGDFPERGGSLQLLHFGTALKVTNNQQLDFHVGVGLTPAAADRIIGFGYSFRFFAK